MRDNKKIITMTLLIIGIVLIVGTSYAFFVYVRESSKNSELIAGEVYMHYVDGTNTIDLTNAFPEADIDARAKNDNYITFTIDGKNTTTNKDIYYEIILNQAEAPNGSTNKLEDSHLKFDLEETKLVDGVSVTNKVLDAVSYNEINNTSIWVNTISKNTTTEIEITYKLRMWISDQVLISDTVEGADYTTGEYTNSYASVKVIVKGDFDEKTATSPVVSGPAVQIIKSRLGTDGLVAVNTSGLLATSGDTIREYRYSGSARHCTYTMGNQTAPLNVDGETCPNVCYLQKEGTGLVLRSDSETFGILSIILSQTLDCASFGTIIYGTAGIEITPNETSPQEGEVKNYIEFNNGEMWRIIGVFEEKNANGETEELVKIVRDEPLLQEEVPITYTYNNVEMEIKFQQVGKDFTSLKYAYVVWSRDKYFNQTNYNDWTKASLQYYLNDETVGAGSYYNSIGTTYKEMIETVEYSLGNVSHETSAQVSYNAERSSTVHQGNQAKWQGKIGMIYPSDYGYAAGSENWTTSMRMYGTVTNTGAFNNWLNDNVRDVEWTISPRSNSSGHAVGVSSSGSASESDVYGMDSLGISVSPVLYLKSSVMITGGDGSYQNPYQVG